MGNIKNNFIVETGAIIGEGTSIGKNSYIGKNVTVGKNNTIASHVVITGNTTIGDDNTIGTHTVLGSAPQDIRTTSDKVRLTIGDQNSIGAYVFITAGTDHGGLETRIFDDNHLMDRIHVGHDVQIGNHCIMQEDAALGGHVIVEDYVIFGKNAAVHQFVEIGTHAKLQDNAALTQDLPPYCVVDGNRAKISNFNQKKIDDYYSKGTAQSIKKAYELVFDNGSPKENAIKALKTQQPKESKKLYQFIIDSKRGIPFKRKTDVN